MRDRHKHVPPGKGEIIFNLCKYSQQCMTNTGGDLELDGDVKCSQHCVVAQQLWKTTIQAHLSSDNVYWLFCVMEEYYSGLLAALSHWWTEGDVLWKEKITIINWCRFCLICASIFLMTLLKFVLTAGSGRKAAERVNLNSGFCIQSCSCQIKHFQLDISRGGFAHERACPFQNKSSHTEPFVEFDFPTFLFSKTLVLQTLMRANAMTGAGRLSAPRILFLPSTFESKSHGRACAEPENNGILSISLPPIKVLHKGK